MRHGLLVSLIVAALLAVMSACSLFPSDSMATSSISTVEIDLRTASAPSGMFTSIPTATAAPTLTPTPTYTPTPTATPTPPAWDPVAPGISRTYLPVPVPERDTLAYAYALRLDPNRVAFRVYYEGDQPHSIAEWQTITGAPVVVNGGFFSGDHRPVGRLVIDGELYGAPISTEERIGTPGLFAVLDDRVEIYALGRSSYSPRGMRFDQAVESYPMLLLPGRQPTYPDDVGRRARRTVIGIDDQGYVVIVLFDSSVFSLAELSRWLAASNLNLDTALNLDGGRSSGLGVALPYEQKLIEAYVPLPIVIGVFLNP